MNRLGRVVAKNNHIIVLQLEQTEKCADCPANCNKPLIDLFGLRKKLFTLSNNNNHYQLQDPNQLIGGDVELQQLIHLNIDQNDLMTSSAWLYLLPLVFCLIGVALGHYLGVMMSYYTDLTALLGLALGLSASYQFFHKKNHAKHLKIRPKVTIL